MSTENNPSTAEAQATDNPFASPEPADNPWGNAERSSDEVTGSEAWLNEDVAAVVEDQITLADPFAQSWIPLEDWVENALEWVVGNFRPFFTAIKAPIDATLTSIDTLLNAAHPLLMIAIFGLLAWQLANKRLAIGTVISLIILGGIGAWGEAMTTLSLVITSVFFCALLGLPLGIVMARSEKVNHILRPTLDAMQTTPAFVYLVPIVMLFGIGNVPGVVVTIIFAMPPIIRLTNLGIRQVPGDLIEAANSFGANPRQMLFKVQLPLAMPTIMAGVNQTLMLCLSMVVIASMISVGGLGLMVLRGIGRLDIGLATVGGVGIVILAIILDRMTQALGQDARSRGARHWYEVGPVGIARRVMGRS